MANWWRSPLDQTAAQSQQNIGGLGQIIGTGVGSIGQGYMQPQLPAPLPLRSTEKWFAIAGNQIRWFASYAEARDWAVRTARSYVLPQEAVVLQVAAVVKLEAVAQVETNPDCETVLTLEGLK